MLKDEIVKLLKRGVSVQEICKKLKCSPSHAYRLVKALKRPAVKSPVKAPVVATEKVEVYNNGSHGAIAVAEELEAKARVIRDAVKALELALK